MSRTAVATGVIHRKSSSNQVLQNFSDEEICSDIDVTQSGQSSESPKCLLKTVRSSPRPPLKPIDNVRRLLEKQLWNDGSASPNNSKTSPGLARLRRTPGGKHLKKIQQDLEQQHLSARDKINSLSVGGGVSLWPDMDNMRLTARETAYLTVSCIALFTFTLFVFKLLHGQLLVDLIYHYKQLQQFPESHELMMNHGNTSFTSSVLHWHTHFISIMEDIHTAFDISLANTSLTYKSCVILYIFGIFVLLYYLADNVFAKSKLTPKRIKIWVCLLVVISTWTGTMMILLAQALNVEAEVETNVHHLSSKLSELVYLNLNLETYHNVLIYWRTRCLPPSAQGTLSIMGVLAVKDVAYYFQYYSLPIFTALLTPVIKLLFMLQQVYSHPPHP